MNQQDEMNATTCSRAKKTCLKPFLYMELQPDGIYNCCPAWLNGKSDGSYAPDKSLLEIWNSFESEQLRRAMLDGSFDFCNAALCPRLAQNALEDVDQILAGGHGVFFKEIFSARQVKIDFPREINLAFDRSCNLTCGSCRNELINFTSKSPEMGRLTEIADKVLELIHSEKKPIRLTITGSGDPFASQLYFNFLRSIDLRKNPEITLLLLTNGIMFDRPHWDRLSNLNGCKNIDALISIDAGFEETYLVNRKGGNWNKLLRNLAFVQELRDKGTLDFVRLDMVVQRNNFKEINAFVEIARSHQFHCAIMRLNNWGTFSDEEFKKRDISSEDHPEHKLFRHAMKNTVTYDKLDLGNLAKFAE